jgi:leader peptidase (prepilin peptidase)/N-methyltransferase
MDFAMAAVLGVLTGAGIWQWLSRDDGGHYRRAGDRPRLPLAWAWVTMPAGAVGGLSALGGASALTPAMFAYLLGAVGLTWIDLDVHRIPDRILVWWAPLLGAAVVAAAGATQQWRLVLDAALTSAALGAAFMVLAWWGSMGLGDVKLAAVTGLLLGCLGPAATVTAVAVGFAVAAAAGVILLAGGANRRTHLAFGPALMLGAAVAIAVHG